MTKITQPIKAFTAGEPAFFIDVEYDSGGNLEPVRLDNSKFSVGIVGSPFSIEPVYTGSAISVSTVSFQVLGEDGSALTSEELTAAGLSINVKGSSSQQGSHDLVNLDQNNDGIFTISAPNVETTAELDGILSLRQSLIKGRKIFRLNSISLLVQVNIRFYWILKVMGKP